MTNDKIDFPSPEEVLPPECVPMAKGLEPLPVGVREFRSKLKERLYRNECPTPEEVSKVNVFERTKLMQAKTRELLDFILRLQILPDENDMEKYDYLAMDWVYSDELNWEGSMAERQAAGIKTTLLST